MFRKALFVLVLTVLIVTVLVSPVLAAMLSPAGARAPTAQAPAVDVATLVSALVLCAWVIESLVEFLVASWVPEGENREFILQAAGASIGVVLAVAFGLNILSAVLSGFGLEPAMPEVAYWVGVVMTGLLLGRGAQWWHDSLTKWIDLDGG